MNHNDIPEWASAPNAKDSITDNGLSVLEELCEAWKGEFGEIQSTVEELGLDIFTGGSGGRTVIPFPDEYVTDIYLDEWEHDTFYVAKVCGIPNPQNYREVRIWNEVYLENDSDLFAPVDAWDERYRWILMKRVSPVSPASTDIAYAQNKQEYYFDENAPDRIEEWLNDEGWRVEDAPENIGLNEEHECLCLFDYGGVYPLEDEFEYPDFLQEAVAEYNEDTDN